MDLLFTLILFVAFCYGIYKWAESKGRNATFFTIAAVLISPLIVGIILLFVPKTLEKQAEEAKALKSLMDE
jgi:hypothetical protein